MSVKINRFTTHILEQIQHLTPNKIILVGARLSNPIVSQLLTNNTTGAIEFVDTTGKIYIQHSPFTAKFKELITDLYDFLDVSTDEEFNQLKETLGDNGIHDEIEAFLDEYENHKATIQEYSNSEYPIIKTYINKFVKGKVLLSQIEKMKSLPPPSNFSFTPKINIDRTIKNLIVIFNNISVPKSTEFIQLLRDRSINIIVIEHAFSNHPLNYWRINDLYPDLYTILYNTKTKNMLKNYI